ncbi:MAG TPA: hypothetical protein P5079_00045 [Elusimicrobiota bacterium]|nr:hypothetical protein [Elusimicrobiota bacterium]
MAKKTRPFAGPARAVKRSFPDTAHNFWDNHRPAEEAGAESTKLWDFHFSSNMRNMENTG